MRCQWDEQRKNTVLSVIILNKRKKFDRDFNRPNLHYQRNTLQVFCQEVRP